MDTLNLSPAAPEIFALIMVCAILIIDLFLEDARRHVSFVLTLAAEEDFDVPTTLDDPPLLATASPVHTWLRRPVASR